jgi:replicative DNA helicase
MKAENKRLEIGQITAGLKQLAKELNVPILLLSQLSRAVEGREDKRPGLSDLRESGDIEQDADAVMFLFREHYYAERERPVQRGGESQEKFDARMADWLERIQRTQGKAEVIIAKQRDGALGCPQLLFDDQTARFRNMRGEP